MAGLGGDIRHRSPDRPCVQTDHPEPALEPSAPRSITSTHRAKALQTNIRPPVPNHSTTDTLRLCSSTGTAAIKSAAAGRAAISTAAEAPRCLITSSASAAMAVMQTTMLHPSCLTLQPRPSLAISANLLSAPSPRATRAAASRPTWSRSSLLRFRCRRRPFCSWPAWAAWPAFVVARKPPDRARLLHVQALHAPPLVGRAGRLRGRPSTARPASGGAFRWARLYSQPSEHYWSGQIRNWQPAGPVWLDPERETRAPEIKEAA